MCWASTGGLRGRRRRWHTAADTAAADTAATADTMTTETTRTTEATPRWTEVGAWNATTCYCSAGTTPHHHLRLCRRCAVPTTNAGGGECMKTFPARLTNELFSSHAFRLGIPFHGGATAMETGGGAALATALPGRIDIPCLANDNAASSGNDGPPHTFDERAMIEINRAYGAFGSGPPGGRTGAPPILWMSITLRCCRRGMAAVQRGDEEDNGASPAAIAMAQQWSTSCSLPGWRRLTALPASATRDCL